MKIARNVAISEWHVEWYSRPGSLSEGAGSPIGLTEGVSSDGCFGSMGLLTGFLLSLKLLSVYVHRSTLPQSRFARQLPQGGSREWVVPFNRALGNCGGAGDFRRPYERLGMFYVPPYNQLLRNDIGWVRVAMYGKWVSA